MTEFSELVVDVQHRYSTCSNEGLRICHVV